jgi:NTP pyrophosphatase (non-canonical NTP hydrolase)
MGKSDFDAINNLSELMYNIAADHGFHGAGGGELDEDAIYLLCLHGLLSEHWEKLRKGITPSPIDGDIFEKVKTMVFNTSRKISSPPTSRKENVDVGRMALFIVNLIGEASELWEATRQNKLDYQCDKDGCLLTCEEEEMADLAIRLMDMAEARGVNLGRAILKKAEYNKSRPFMHGKKSVI